MRINYFILFFFCYYIETMTEPAEETAETPVEVAQREEAPVASEPVVNEPVDEPSSETPTPVEPLPTKPEEKAECSMCGKSMKKKSLSQHMRISCKQRPTAPKVTAVPVREQSPAEAPVEKVEAQAPAPEPLERQPSKKLSKVEESDNEDYEEKVEEAEARAPVRMQRPLTRVDKMRLLAQSGLP